MIEKIIFSMVSFVFFTYIFLFKMIKRNDTSYLIVLIFQAIGIAINFIQIIFGILDEFIFKAITYILCIIIPMIIIAMETSGMNFTELISGLISKFFLLIGDKKTAKAILVNLVTKYKDSYLGHKMLADMYQKEGGMRKAIDEYVKALDLKKDDYKSYYTISVLLNDLGKKDESIEMLQNLLKTKPEFYDASEMLGNLLCEKERFKDAVNVYMEALKYNPEKYEIYYDLGIAYTRMNDFQTAKEYYEKAAEINNNAYNAYYRLGQISLLYRDLDAAEEYFAKGLYGDTESKGYYQLAKIYMMKNQKEKASMFLNKSIELEPEFYEKAKKEPIFFGIKKNIQPPEKEVKKEQVKQSKKEKDIEAYLDDTYTLTKNLNLKESKEQGFTVNEFKWRQGYQKERKE